MKKARHLNLLPQERRKDLKREVLISATNRFLRSVLFGLGLMTAVALGTSLVMGALTVASSSLADTELINQVKLYKDVESEIEQQNERLRLVNSLEGDRILWSRALENLLEIVPPGATIEMIIGREDGAKIIFEGVAPTRTSLVVFRERLSSLPWVMEVESPGSNLLSRENPRYSFTLIINEDELFKLNSDGKKDKS